MRGSEIGYELFVREFFIKITPLVWGAYNFLTSSSFLPIFCAIDAPRGRLHLLFGHYKKWGPPTKRRAPTLSDRSWAALPYVVPYEGSHFAKFYVETWHNLQGSKFHKGKLAWWIMWRHSNETWKLCVSNLKPS